MARRLGPAFPNRTRGQRAARAAGGQLRDLTQPPDRAEDQCHSERQQRQIAQRIGVSPRHTQITLYRFGCRRPCRHPFLMGLPDRRRRRITRADCLIVQQRPNGPPRQAGIQPGQRIGA